MLSDMTLAMPRFDQFISLYPSSERLQRAVLDLYLDYIDLCVSSARFLSRAPWRMYPKL